MEAKGGKMMKKHGKKMIAPVIVTLVILAYFAGIIAAFTLIPGIPAAVKGAGKGKYDPVKKSWKGYHAGF